ncbi:hypothetical protein B0H13DRAFT_2352746 [Mycena leptocephala]|nr:hypothetical protein B0H13DRAFT_2352746 [Mycena leptocephala]
MRPLGPAFINDKLKHSHLNATTGEDKTTGEEDRILLALYFMVKETYKSDRRLPSAISTLRHVIKHMSTTKSPHVMDAFVLAVRSFTQKEYAAQGDSTCSVLFGVAQYLTYNDLLGIYVLQLSALISRMHRIPPRLASTATPNQAERTG